jgi:dolichyl-phosphate-mannose-protein mannosyltransferase
MKFTLEDLRQSMHCLERVSKANERYINGKFFMDVHPPLAKILIALTGWLAGFKGDFDFKEIGKYFSNLSQCTDYRDYISAGVPYVAMRLLPAILGILVVPIIFLTLRSSGCTQTTALLGAILITFENGLITQSRLILLDSPLVMCTAFTVYAWTVFEWKYHSAATLEGAITPAKDDDVFSADWWTWLLLTGFGLGATVSMKWVGLFTIAWVGSLTVLQLWNLLGDLRITPVRPPISGLIEEYVDETFSCSSIVSHCHSCRVLYGNV